MAASRKSSTTKTKTMSSPEPSSPAKYETLEAFILKLPFVISV
jgi:hypothetical protein